MEIKELKSCTLCPRNCCVNRYQTLGFCKASDKIKLSYYHLHMWEEPCLSGTNGSGTVFFANCNMKCLFCQNQKISINGYGQEISNSKLEKIFLKLQAMNAHNINLVTPTHYVPQIKKVLKKIKNKSLTIPVVYNTSSYENVETINSLKGLIDIYLPDLKWYSDELSMKYSNTPNYFENASKAIDVMVKQVGKNKFKNNLMINGVIVRVLVIPGEIEDAKRIIKYLYDKYQDSITISIMNQYTPIKEFKDFKNLNRKLSNKEYNEVINYAYQLGIRNAYIQEGETADESFIPDFNIKVI